MLLCKYISSAIIQLHPLKSKPKTGKQYKGKNEEKKNSIRKFEIGYCEAAKAAYAVMRKGQNPAEAVWILSRGVVAGRYRMLSRGVMAGRILMVLNRVIIVQTRNNSSWGIAFTGVRVRFRFGNLLWLKFV